MKYILPSIYIIPVFSNNTRIKLQKLKLTLNLCSNVLMSNYKGCSAVYKKFYIMLNFKWIEKT